MARRSYTAKANKGKAASVFFNNVAHGIEKSRREEKKRQEQDARRSAREYERAKKRREREAQQERKRQARADERAQIRHEREQERKAKENARDTAKAKKLREKLDKFEARTKLELQKIGLYPAQEVLSQIAAEAEGVGTTLAQIKKYFIDDHIDQLRKKTAKGMVDQEILSSYRKGALYKSSVGFAAAMDVQDLKTFKKECSDFSALLAEQEKEEEKIKKDEELRLKQRKYFREKLNKGKKEFFRDELREIWDLAEEKKWNIDDIESSDQYKNGIKNYQNYKKDLEDIISSFE